jgi:hypothetical protein
MSNVPVGRSSPDGVELAVVGAGAVCVLPMLTISRKFETEPSRSAIREA